LADAEKSRSREQPPTRLSGEREDLEGDPNTMLRVVSKL
jgi:hypothetical protein